MQMIYSHQNPTLVGYAKGMTDNAGIATVIRNEDAGTGLGPPYSSAAELWLIHDQDYQEALKILQPILEAYQD